jgi:hypothetical protein
MRPTGLGKVISTTVYFTFMTITPIYVLKIDCITVAGTV